MQAIMQFIRPLGRRLEPIWLRVRDLRWGGRTGLLLGGVAVFLALAGLVEFFAKMDIVDVELEIGGQALAWNLPMSAVFLVLPALLAGFMAAGLDERGGRPRSLLLALLNGALAGLLVAAFLAGLAGLVDGLTAREAAVWRGHVLGFGAFRDTAMHWPALAMRIGEVPWPVRQIGLRDILVGATPELVTMLTQGQTVAGGAGILLGGGIALGLLGVGLRYLAPLHRRVVWLGGGLVLVGAVLREFFRPLLPSFGLSGPAQRLFYVGQGLSLWGALILIVLGAALVYLLPLLRRAIATPAGRAIWYGQLGVLLLALILLAVVGSLSLPEVAALAVVWVSRVLALLFVAGLVALVVLGLVGRFQPAGERPAAPAPPGAFSKAVSLVIAFAALLVLPFLLREQSEILNKFGLAVLMGLGLNIVVGFAGLLDLGYVAFYAIGAYVVGVLTSLAPYLQRQVIGWSFWEALPVAVVAAALAGVILGIPVLRMRGDYLAIVTLAFGEIIRVLVKSDLLKPYIGGAQGILNIPPVSILGWRLNTPQTLYFVIFACVLVALFVSTRLAPSRIGRAWMAMRDDEDVAEAVGVPLVSYKLLAFATGAAFSGMAGAIFAAKVGSDFPSSFDLLISINILCVIIVGGMGSNPGVVVGALVLYVVPELLQVIPEFRYMIFGALLVVMMLVRPEGLWPARRMRRLREEERENA